MMNVLFEELENVTQFVSSRVDWHNELFERACGIVAL